MATAEEFMEARGDNLRIGGEAGLWRYVADLSSKSDIMNAQSGGTGADATPWHARVVWNKKTDLVEY